MIRNPSLGQRVIIRRGRNVYTGRVYAARKDGTYDVLTDSGAPMEHVRPGEMEHVRPGEMEHGPKGRVAR